MATLTSNPPDHHPDEQDESKNGVRGAQQRVHGRDAAEPWGAPHRKNWLNRERSVSLGGGDTETKRRPLQPKQASGPARAPSHSTGGDPDASEAEATNGRLAQDSAGTSWPGPDFELKNILPGSVYLWACGERGEDDGTSDVSRPESMAAWVVLITQFLCYVELWAVSGDPDDTPEYSIVAIAVAMYLLLSIAAADLWGGLALVLEGRADSGGSRWFASRKAFGACLLVTFGALVGASTRVLFYSSFENVDWVLGAAAALFIADVDEKAMRVLSNVGGGWRLFWVLQAIGSSFILAVLVVKLTGNGDTVSGGGGDRGGSYEQAFASVGCSIYSWFFVLNMYPLTVTLFSLLVTRAFSRPEFSVLPRGLLHAPSRRGDRLCFSMSWVCWVLYRIATSWMFGPDGYITASTTVAATVLFAGGIALLWGCGHFCRKVKLAYARGSQRFRPVDRRRRRWLFGSGLLLYFVRAALELVRNGAIQLNFSRSVNEPVREVVGACSAVFDTALDAWLLFGMGLTQINSPSFPVVDPGRSRTSLLWPMLVGWAFYEGYVALEYWIVFGGKRLFDDRDLFWKVFPAFAFAGDFCTLMWRLIVGTLLWGWTFEIRAVAYWLAANRLIRSFLWCVLTIVLAAQDRVVR